MNRRIRVALVSVGIGAIAALPFALASAPVPPTSQVPLARPEAAQPLIAETVVSTLRDGHFRPRKIDDALSRGWFTTYLERLDPARIYFTAADIAEFSRWSAELDDDALNHPPKLLAAWQVFERYRLRSRERIAFARQILAEDRFDFSKPGAEVDVVRDEKDPWPASSAELDALWRPRVAAQVLDLELEDESHAEAIARLDRRFKRMLKDLEGTEPADVLEVYLGAFAAQFDPHSVWMKPISKQNFDIELQDTLIGIGAVLNSDDGYTVIKELIGGGPAEKSGQLEAGDRILAVAQGEADPVDIVDMRLDDVVQLIRGKEGTTVRLTVKPAKTVDPTERRVIDIVRAKVKIADASAKAEVRKVEGLSVGVIDVPSFYVDSEGRRQGLPDYASTTRDVARHLADFTAQGVHAVVIDLRQNGGGSLDEAVNLTGLFLQGGPVVQIRDNRGRTEVLKDEDPRMAWAGPVVVLTSEASASASEIFAAALQDYGRGIVVGATSTHGKGSVQNLLPLAPYLARMGLLDGDVPADEAGSVKFTTHMFYRVNGASTQVKGVVADVVLPSPWEGIEGREADLDNPLPFDQIAPARYSPAPLKVDLDALRVASSARVRQSMGFAFLAEDILERNQNRDKELLSLHRDTRLAERARYKKIEENRKTAWSMEGFDPEKPPDPILEEAVQIAVDFSRQRAG